MRDCRPDGDGVYDYVIKQPNGNVDPYIKYWKPSPETYKIEAYLADGTFLWRHDMGWSIERGIWYSPYVVYDLDGDGKAEVCLKAGEGDPRDEDGHVSSGPEYLLILDGMTGKEKARATWPDRDAFPNYNYASRNQLAVAYLDGKTPSLIIVRGTYNVIVAIAYEYRDGKLRELWRWNEAEEGGRRYRGQGAHSMHAVDIDNDGRDEVFLRVGRARRQRRRTVDDPNGTSGPSLRRRHRSVPTRPGGLLRHRNPCQKERLLPCRRSHGRVPLGNRCPTRHLHATGMCSDIDGSVPGIEAYSSDTDAEKKSNVRWLFDAKGNVLRDDLDWGFGFKAVYWDAEPATRASTRTEIFDYGSDDTILNIEGSVVAYADVLGDCARS